MNAAAVTVSDDDEDLCGQDSDVMEVRRPIGHASTSNAQGFSKFKGKINIFFSAVGLVH